MARRLVGQEALNYIIANPDAQYKVNNYGGINPQALNQLQSMKRQQVQQADVQSRWANQDKGFLGNLAWGLSSPLRTLIEGGADLLGFQPSKPGTSTTGLMSDDELNNIAKNPFGAWLGETAKAGSFLLPGLKAAGGASAFGQGIAGAAKLGAASQGLYGFGNAVAKPNTDLGQILGETAQNAATGAAFGAGGALLGKAAQGAKGLISNTKLGQGLESLKLKNLGVNLPKNDPAAAAIQKDLEQNAGRILDQFGGGQYSPKGMSNAYATLKNNLTQAARKSNVLIDKDTILQDFVDSTVGKVDLSKGLGKDTANMLFTQLDNTPNNLAGMLKLKFDLQNKLGAAYKKMANGVDPNAFEKTTLALHDAIDSQIKTISPEIANTLKDMSVLHNAAPDIIKSSTRGINVGVPMSGIKVNIKPTLDASRNLISNMASKTRLGGVLNKPLSTADLGIVLRSPAAKAALKSLGLTGATQTANGNVKSPTTLQDFGDVGKMSNEQLYQLLTGQGQQTQQAPEEQPLDYATAYQMAIQRFGARNRSEANTIANSLLNDSANRIKAKQAASGSGGMGKVAAKDMVNAQSGLQSLKDIQDLLSNNEGLLLKGLIPDILAPTEVRQFNLAKRNSMDAIARLRTGGVISPSEEKLYYAYLPEFYDDPATVERKLQRLGGIFQALAGGQGGYDETNSSINYQ